MSCVLLMLLPTTGAVSKQAAQMTEVYWMALARDVPFTKFATDPLVRAAAGTCTRELIRALVYLPQHTYQK